MRELKKREKERKNKHINYYISVFWEHRETLIITEDPLPDRQQMMPRQILFFTSLILHCSSKNTTKEIK